MTRVIAGSVGGRRLSTPTGRGTRPTAERVREGLFSTLEALHGSLAGAGFLDLYAGSGAVGFEAASRGAAPVTLVEHDPNALRAIRANLAALDLPNVEIQPVPVERLLAGASDAAYDIVFCDPPYAVSVSDVLGPLVTGGWLRRGGLVAVERSSRDARLRWPDGLEPLRTRRYGDTTLCYGSRS